MLFSQWRAEPEHARATRCCLRSAEVNAVPACVPLTNASHMARSVISGVGAIHALREEDF